VILLDTSLLSRVFRRKAPGIEEQRLQLAVAKLLASDVPVALPGIVLQEVLSGIRTETQFVDLKEHLLASFAIVHPSTQDYIEAARLMNRCSAAGLNVSAPDCLIAILAISTDRQLFTLDDDFQAIARHAPLKLYQG
jgi:predicted nucleic acid-binding protein